MPDAAREQTSSHRRVAVALSAALCAGAFCLTASAADFVVTSAADSGPGSLRQAIANSNAAPGCDSIVFDLAPDARVIAVASQLPTIRECLTIDGGGTGMTLDGIRAGAASGLIVEGADVHFERIAVIRFARDGIHLTGGEYSELLDLAIGTDLKVSHRLGNARTGLRLTNAHALVGNATIGANVTGIETEGTSALQLGGSVIGGGSLGNFRDGIILGGEGSIIGFVPCPFECPPFYGGNIIEGNGGSGIVLSGRSCFVGNNEIRENGLDGVRAIAGEGNVIQANSISGNAGNGIGVLGGFCEVFENEISGNAGLPIDLGGDGPTPNDPLDADSGPNGLLNTPTLREVVVEPFGTTVAGDVDSQPDSEIFVDLYAATTCEEPAREMFPVTMVDFFQSDGRTTVYTDHAGHGSLLYVFPTRPDRPHASFFLATSTSKSGTSEASGCIAARESSHVDADLSVEYAPVEGPVAPGSRVTFVITVTNHGPAAATEVWLDSPLTPGGVVESASTTQGACYLTGLGFCMLGGLAAGQSAVIEKTVRIGEPIATIVDTASIRHFDQPDPVPANDAAASTVDVGYLRRHPARPGRP